MYTSARLEAFADGLSLVRPMYYDFPEIDDAYPPQMNFDAQLGQLPATRQYLFGPDLLVAPVTAASDCTDGGKSASSLPPLVPCGLTRQTVWIPPGEWVELSSGTC